ncbi:electron transport complex subunit C [Echria macrotheca]|uniref:Electron transport complex subunit C n=1 Tax=Echria macrotheca TaxID=438768 RepID=A0AAJ0BLY0_9PEZI|nr:electron transport complex subunit C [Echria macrotheca]
MGASFAVIKTLIAPAIISLILFLLSTYVLYPLWQHYRTRYSNYLPLETISSQTSSLRTRIQDAIARFLAPSLWRRSVTDTLVVAESGSDAGFDSDDGEELGAVHHPSGVLGHSRPTIDSIPRLSRDLEEGFMDDSDDELDHSGGRR